MIKKYQKGGRVALSRGAATITAVLFFIVVSLAVVVGLALPVVNDYRTTRDFGKSKEAYYLSESGSEDVLYRLKKGITTDAQEYLALGGNVATTTVTTVSSVKKTVDSIGDIFTNTRRVSSALTTTIGASFVYGVQAGAGGVQMSNTASIVGNLFSAGPVVGAGNLITGTVASTGTTGSNGSISGVVNQGGSAMYAGSIANSTISGTPYCNTITGSTPGVCQPLQQLNAADLPFSAQDIANWELAAASGGTKSCGGATYSISVDTTLGPTKIPCNLALNGATSGAGPTITLRGPVWVTGDIDIKDNLTIRIEPTYVGQSIMMIADNPADHLTSSTISVEGNGLNFVGAGANSWTMLISENSSASTGGGSKAIEFEQGANGAVLLYARLGNIILKDASSIVNVTAYKLTLTNTAKVVYSLGLQNALFTTGPSGAWWVQDWKEGQ